jgi:hypothetical protein
MNLMNGRVPLTKNSLINLVNRRVPLTKLFETITLPEQLPAAAIKRLFMSSISIKLRVCIKLTQRWEAVND